MKFWVVLNIFELSFYLNYFYDGLRVKNKIVSEAVIPQYYSYLQCRSDSVAGRSLRNTSSVIVTDTEWSAWAEAYSLWRPYFHLVHRTLQQEKNGRIVTTKSYKSYNQEVKKKRNLGKLFCPSVCLSKATTWSLYQKKQFVSL